MKKFLALFWKVVSVPITFALAFAMQFWWLYLILLAIGAYKTAAKEWGTFAGIISVLVAFVLPILTFYLWCEAIGKEDWKKRYSKGKQKDGKHGSVPNNDDFERYQFAYLRLLSAMMAKMAKADGRVDVSEIRAAEVSFGRLGFSDIQKQVCILAFRNALIATHHISHYARQLVELKFSYELRMIAYEILWDIACADGVLDLKEKILLESLEKNLLLAPVTFNRFFRQRVRRSYEGNREFNNTESSSSHRGPLSDEYEELGCSSSATDEELRTAYRNLAKRLHPDILRAQGIPEALMGKANARMARINAAWDKIKKARGMRN